MPDDVVNSEKQPINIVPFKKRGVLAKSNVRKRAADVDESINECVATKEFESDDATDDAITTLHRPEKLEFRPAQTTKHLKTQEESSISVSSIKNVSSGARTDQYATAQAADVSSATSNTNARRGPARAPANIRVTARFDYQPDICKDYKETGFCTFGDSCKFLHDRGDYKSGWQLDKEWEEQQKGAGGDERDYSIEEAKDDNVDDLPFACLICRKEFTDPVVTKCKHYFCEICAIQHYSKSKKCFACGESTNGAFKVAHDLVDKILEKKQRILELNDR